MKRILTAVAATTILVSLGACSSSKKPAKKSTTATSSPVTSATTAAPTTPTSSGQLPTEAQVTAALLSAADLGAGFTAGTFTKTNTSPPCAAAGSPSFRQQTSPAVDAGATLKHATPQASLDEVIFVYADAATAQQAFATGKSGLSCTTGTVYYTDGTKGPITITPPIDVSTDVGADTAAAWQLKNADVQSTQVVSLVGSVILTLGFSAATGADTSTLPNPIDVAKAAVAKLKSG